MEKQELKKKLLAASVAGLLAVSGFAVVSPIAYAEGQGADAKCGGQGGCGGMHDDKDKKAADADAGAADDIKADEGAAS